MKIALWKAMGSQKELTEQHNAQLDLTFHRALFRRQLEVLQRSFVILKQPNTLEEAFSASI